MQNTGGKAIGYIRVSTKDQHLGPEAQLAAIIDWCARNGVELVETVTEKGVHGDTEIEKRDGLVEALTAIEGGRASILLVMRRDRLARDVMIVAMVERLLARQGAVLRSTDGASDIDGPDGFLVKRMQDVIAEYERLTIRLRTKGALAVKKRRGERTGDIPYGYTIDQPTVRDARGCTLVAAKLLPNPDEQAAIECARALKAEGRSLRAIAVGLAAAGFRSRAGGEFHPQQIARLLTSNVAPIVQMQKAA